MVVVAIPRTRGKEPALTSILSVILEMDDPAATGVFYSAALDAAATPLKPATKSLWGYSGVVQAPDGTIWKVATSSKGDSGPATTPTGSSGRRRGPTGNGQAPRPRRSRRT
jgi:uncharacterized glyoxalase superfamily protein PhnB